MHGTIPHKLSNGSLIPLPVPTFAVAYTVIEDEREIVVVFAMKQPGPTTVSQVLKRAIDDFPTDVQWTTYPCAETGMLEGSPNKYEEYTLLKQDGKIVIDAERCGDMAVAFQNFGNELPSSAKSLDLEALLMRLTPMRSE